MVVCKVFLTISFSILVYFIIWRHMVYIMRSFCLCFSGSHLGELTGYIVVICIGLSGKFLTLVGNTVLWCIYAHQLALVV